MAAIAFTAAPTVVIRAARGSDGPALRRLAELGSREGPTRDVLLDAKHWTQECPLGDRCRSESLRNALANKLLVEARRQIDAVRHTDTAIEWRVVDEEMALRIADILDEGIGAADDRNRIRVIYTAVSDIVQ